MKKILISLLAAAVFCCPLFAMGAVSNLKAKAEAVKGEDREMIKSIDVLENYDVLLKMDVLEDIEKNMEKENSEEEPK